MICSPEIEVEGCTRQQPQPGKECTNLSLPSSETTRQVILESRCAYKMPVGRADFWVTTTGIMQDPYVINTSIVGIIC